MLFCWLPGLITFHPSATRLGHVSLIENSVTILKRRRDMAGKLIEYFNKQPRLGVIRISSKDGKVDSAVYGSPQMID
jgi:hypothetical protein